MVGYKRIYIALCVLILLPFVAVAQVNRYMVFFKDKTGTPYSIDQPDKFLSAKSLARRNSQGILITAQDLPVNPAYITQVKSTGAKTYFPSRWMNGVLAEINQDSLKKVLSLSCVDSVVYAAPGNKLSGGRIKKLKNRKSTTDASATLPQLQQLGLDEMHREGFHGENISIAVLDGGFPGVDTGTSFQSLYSQGQLKMTFNFVLNTSNVFQACSDCEHGTEVLSTIAVNTNTFTGGAYAANFYLFVTEDVSSEYRVEEFNWLFGAEKADSAGVDIISTSLGYNQFDDSTMDYKVTDMNGKRTISARAATMALSKGIVVVCSAGNEGSNSWRIVTTPADAAGVLACGAIDIGGSLAPFSSVGPSADGRIKPDVVALGVGASVVLSGGGLGTNNGTSFSAPLVAGLAAGVTQAFPYLTSAQVYQAIIKSANRASSPDNSYGYGVPFFTAVKNYVDESDTISVYPNPSNSDKVNIKFTYNTGDATVYFFDTFGRLMLQRSVTIASASNPIEFDVSPLASGVYIIKVRSSFATKTFRFVRSG